MTADRLRIRLFGPFGLSDETGADLTPSGRKARGLLFYLLRAPDGSASRAELMQLLWGDRGEEQARQSLRQTLYELRDLSAGEPPLLAVDRMTVRLDPTRVRSDLDTPGAGGSGGSAEPVTDLDRLSPAFDRWLAAERVRLRAERAASLGVETPPTVPVPRPAATASIQPGRRAWVLAACGMALIAAGIWAFVLLRAQPGAQRLILVKPLQADAGDAPARQLAQDLASDLSRAILGNDAILRVGDGQDDADARKAAFRVDGRAQTSGDALHVSVNLRGPEQPGILWSQSFDRPVAQLPALREEVALRLAAVIVCALGSGGVPDGVDAETLSLYLEACDLRGLDDTEVVRLMRQVVRRAPNFGKAWGNLAISLVILAEQETGAEAERLLAETDAMAARALQLDPMADNAYYARARRLRGIGQWAERERIVEAGLNAVPDSAPLRTARAAALSQLGLQRESIPEFRRAAALDPLLHPKQLTLASVLANAGRSAEADAITDRVRQRYPTSWRLWKVSFETAAWIGDPKRALALLDDPARPTRWTPAYIAAWRAFLQARETGTGEAVDTALQAIDTARRQDAAVPPYQIVDEATVLGRIDEAVALALAQAETRIDTPYAWFANYMAPLRTDPRFMEIARRQGLVDVWRQTGRWPDFCADGSVPYDCRAVAERQAISAR